jgi:cytochrome c biogenesis protein CcdA/thiol-disulfide isomerase/thioredoxin
MLLLLISFLAGVLTVLAPCVLPLLPVIVGGSLADGKVQKRKAFTIIISLGISVLFFTWILKVSTLFIAVPPQFWQILSGVIIMTIGVVMLFPALYEGKFLSKLSIGANRLLGKGDQQHNFLGDMIVGASLGPVFSTCSPTYFIVLASVLPVNAFLGFIYMCAYVLGLCLMLLVVTFLGQKVLSFFGAAADPRGIFKKVLGVLFLLVGLFVLTGGDKALQSAILEKGFFDVTKIEQMLLSIGEEKKAEVPYEPTRTPEEKALYYRKAPEISTPDGFVNTNGEPITLESLRGKVVLLDIWTYSCINCQRTLPYIEGWYEKYKDDGLVVVGLHTPEFAFEKVQKNVEAAVKKFGLTYPTVLDNDFSTWNEYGNRYWPRKYLIDIDGFIVYDHIGEGEYENTERAIRQGLTERAARNGEEVDLDTDLIPEVPLARGVGSPEIYFGAWRNERLANGPQETEGVQTLTLPTNIELNKLYLSGVWDITREYAEGKSEGSIVFKYKAKDIHMVASSEEPIEAKVYQDGVFVKTITIEEDGLYTLMQNQISGEHTIEIRLPKPGLKAFTFTFG